MGICNVDKELGELYRPAYGLGSENLCRKRESCFKQNLDRMDTCLERKIFTVPRLQTTSTCLQWKNNQYVPFPFQAGFTALRLWASGM